MPSSMGFTALWFGWVGGLSGWVGWAGLGWVGGEIGVEPLEELLEGHSTQLDGVHGLVVWVGGWVGVYRKVEEDEAV